MGLSFFNAERQRKKAIKDSLLISNEEQPTSPSLRGVEVGEPQEEIKEEVKPKKKRTK